MRRFWLLCGVLVFLLLTPSPRVRADAAGVPRSFHAGWNLVALPRGTALTGVQELYTFQPGDSDYEAVQPDQGSEAGLGYWAYFGANTAVNLAQGGSDAYSVDAPAGQFIMIGDPSGSMPATVSGADAVYTYDAASGYQQTTTLLQGQGAWVMSTDGGTITVTPAATAPPGAPASNGPAGGTVVGSPAAAAAAPVAAAAGPSDAEIRAAVNSMAPDQVTTAPDSADPRYVVVTSSWGYQMELPGGWIQAPPPRASDNPIAPLVNNMLDSFRSADASVSLAVQKFPIHPAGYDALHLAGDVVTQMKAQADQGVGALTDFQILDPPHAVELPGADSAATAETSSKLIIIDRTAIQRTITALKGDAMYEFILTWKPDLPADTLLPTGFQLAP